MYGEGHYPALHAGRGAMAFELAIISIVAGIALGLRYKVLILVPAAALVMVFAMIVGIGRADPLSSIILAMAGLGTPVQFGYLAGIVIRGAFGSVILLPHAQAAQRRAP